MSIHERYNLLKDNAACFDCLKSGHILHIMTAGGIEILEDSYNFVIQLQDINGRIVYISAYGISKITNDIYPVEKKILRMLMILLIAHRL